jgi:hypothetical protein
MQRNPILMVFHVDSTSRPWRYTLWLSKIACLKELSCFNKCVLSAKWPWLRINLKCNHWYTITLPHFNHFGSYDGQLENPENHVPVHCQRDIPSSLTAENKKWSWGMSCVQIIYLNKGRGHISVPTRSSQIFRKSSCSPLWDTVKQCLKFKQKINLICWNVSTLNYMGRKALSRPYLENEIFIKD